MDRNILLAGLGGVAAVVAYTLLNPTAPQPPSGASAAALVSITMPQIEGNAAIGQRIFTASCSGCHGPDAVGKDGAGPPLIHKIYEPSHHGDESFQRAVAHGVRAHHWRFGDMPAVEGLTRADVAMVIDYIRQIQRANGIN